MSMALVTSIRKMRSPVILILYGDVNHSTKLACGGILTNGDGNKIANTDEECDIVAEDAQLG